MDSFTHLPLSTSVKAQPKGVDMHYYQFHIGDYRAGTIHLTQIERWVYRDLLDCLYDTEKPLPTDFDKVCMMVGARSEEHREAVKIVLLQKFTETVDGFINNRFLQELEKYQSKAERAINANKKRWGHDNVLKSDVISDTDQIATNNQEPITNNHKLIKRVKEIAPPDGVLESVWQDFVSQRKAKKSPITQTAIKGIEREANKANISLNDALQEICARGWTGFKADWMTKTADKQDKVYEAPWQKAARLRMAEFAPSVAAKDPNEENVIDMDFFNKPQRIKNVTFNTGD